MFDAIAILTVAGSFLAILWLSLALARLLLRAVLASMQHCAERGPAAALLQTPAGQRAKSKTSVREPRSDSPKG